MNSIPKLQRSLTCHKINYVHYILDYMNLKSTTVLIELVRKEDDSWLAHYVDIDENGNRTLEQKEITDLGYQSVISQFGVSLLSA